MTTWSSHGKCLEGPTRSNHSNPFLATALTPAPLQSHQFHSVLGKHKAAKFTA